MKEDPYAVLNLAINLKHFTSVKFPKVGSPDCCKSWSVTSLSSEGRK